MSKFISLTKSLMAILLMAVFVAGCGSGSSAAPGTLGVSLTDAPACGFDAVNVTENHLADLPPPVAVGL